MKLQVKNILIIGATGNVGIEVVRYLTTIDSLIKVFVGVRNIEKAQQTLKDFPDVEYVYFDFENPDSYKYALNGIDRVFLLRPPHISDVDTYFKPLIDVTKQSSISDVVFLSVQGAEKSKVIPHNKIERLIEESGLSYVFLRPSYFMQNLTTTLIEDIRNKRQIILPSGNAKFNWINVENIGEAAAILLSRFDLYKNNAYELTGLENENFRFVINLINSAIQNPIEYKNTNLFRFFNLKKKEGMPMAMVIVMILLHLLPRFQKEPLISDFYEQLTGKKPTDLKTFINREKELFERSDSGA